MCTAHLRLRRPSRLLRYSRSCLSQNPPVAICDITPSMTLSNGPWRQRTSLPCLEPKSLSRDDGKRPDGLTVLPWANGRCLVWDFTCPDTLAASHLNRAVVSPGLVANDAEDLKTMKYRTLAPLYNFMPIAVESLGALGDCATDFFKKLGQRISVATGEPRSSQFLFQRLSVAIQRGNAACVVGTLPGSLGLEDIFYI